MSPVRSSGWWKEYPRENKHEGGADQPVQYQRYGHEALVGHDPTGFVVTNFRQRRIHHDQQADGNGDGDTSNLHRAQPFAEPRNGTTQKQAGAHGQPDPQWEETVEK